MALIQVRDVPESTVRVLRARAGARGMSLAAYLRQELDRLATTQQNRDAVARLRGRDRATAPTEMETVAELRNLRDSS